MFSMRYEDALTALEYAKREFIARDSYLLERDANERSMTHKFAGYLEEAIRRQFPTLHVDCEYNRDSSDKKRLAVPKRLSIAAKKRVRLDNDRGGTVFPDIIVHRRGTSENVIVIEAKKSGGDTEFDCEKLKAFLGEYGYEHAMLIVFVTDGEPNITIEPIQRGSAPTASINRIKNTALNKVGI